MQKPRFSNNPIIPDRGICDPHIHIFQDKAYLYASHDRSPVNDSWFMDDWEIWSSGNLVDWKHESTLRPEDTYLKRCERCWAVDTAERNGRYYLYFSNGTDDTGVAVSDHPGHGFRDALGKPILPKGLTDTHQYDPTVFIDDDPARTPYLIWGCGYYGSGYKIARLNEDMISLAEPPRNLLIDLEIACDDKSFVHKHDGVYYLSWASHYATADKIDGPYTYRGNIRASFDHGSFFEWKGQSFFAYGMFDASFFYRSSGLCYIHYRANGEMVADQMICNFGVGHYDARWDRIEACWYMEGAHVRKMENYFTNFDVVIEGNRSFLKYPAVHDLRANAELSLFCICNDAQDVVIEVREQAVDGPIIGECPVPPSGTWRQHMYRFRNVQLKNSAGVHDLYFTFRGQGQGQDLLRIGWFRFR